MILTGMAGIIVIEIYTAVMLRFFENTNNKVGKGFAILGIYLFVVCYSKRAFPDPWEAERADAWEQMGCSTARRGCTVQRCCRLP